MIEKDIVIKNRAGIHTRPAAMIVKLAAKYKSEIYLKRDGFGINAKSIIGVMTLAAEQGAILTLCVDGSDEEEAAEVIGNLLSSGFNEK
jgi:phosphocarrier protein